MRHDAALSCFTHPRGHGAPPPLPTRGVSFSNLACERPAGSQFTLHPPLRIASRRTSALRVKRRANLQPVDLGLEHGQAGGYHLLRLAHPPLQGLGVPLQHRLDLLLHLPELLRQRTVGVVLAAAFALASGGARTTDGAAVAVLLLLLLLHRVTACVTGVALLLLVSSPSIITTVNRGHHAAAAATAVRHGGPGVDHGTDNGSSLADGRGRRRARRKLGHGGLRHHHSPPGSSSRGVGRARRHDHRGGHVQGARR
ncbi:unnamed protein product [Ectocarpus fasciculatus]